MQERDGWLMVPYDGLEIATIELGFDGEMAPAYLDWDDAGRRVAQVRATDLRRGAATVTVYVNGEQYSREGEIPAADVRGTTAGSVSTSQTRVL